MIRFSLWGDEHAGSVAVDPFAVAAVTETNVRSGHGTVGDKVAILRLNDGAEFTVRDDDRTVVGRIEAGRSVILP